jgi:hypothetical protein
VFPVLSIALRGRKRTRDGSGRASSEAECGPTSLLARRRAGVCAPSFIAVVVAAVVAALLHLGEADSSM